MAVPFPDPASESDAPARLLAEGAPGDNAPALSVSQLSAAIKRTVEDGFARVRVRGELSGTKRAASGHFYAALKDDNALIDMVMWKGQAGRLAFRPEDGIEVIATGKLTTYPGRSKYQIVIETMEIAGEGALLALLARNKARFEAEGGSMFGRNGQRDRHRAGGLGADAGNGQLVEAGDGIHEDSSVWGVTGYRPRIERCAFNPQTPWNRLCRAAGVAPWRG